MILGASVTHKQSTQFFWDPIDEFSMVDDSVQKFFPGDGGAANEAAWIFSAV